MKLEENKPEESHHHTNFEAFAQSAAAGCRVCSLLITQLTLRQRQQMLSYNRGSDASLGFQFSGRDNEPVCEVRVAYFLPLESDGEQPQRVWMKLRLSETTGHERLPNYTRQI